MKYGAHIFLWTDRWDERGPALLDNAASLGLDHVEIAVGDDVDLNPAQVGRHAAGLGLDLTLSPGGEWPMECDISLKEAAPRQRGLDWHRRWIDQAAQAGALAYTGALYGHPGHVERRPDPDEFQRTADGLRQLTEFADDRGVKLVIEPMSHFRTHLVNTPAQAMRFADAVGHPNLFVLLDTYHLVTEIRDYADAIRTTAARLWAIHACENDRGVPGGGLVPWPTIFDALHDIDFDGYVVLESYNSTLGDFAHARGMFHNVCPDGDDFVRTALRFLKRTQRRD